MKISTFSPQTCVICETNICYDELPVCKNCIHHINRIITARCKVCGKEGFSCDCKKQSFYKALFDYTNDYMSHFILAHIKNFSDERFMDFLAELIVSSFRINPKLYDAVTFVPRKPLRKRIYGHNQAEQFANSIATRLGLPVVRTLERIGGRQQKSLTAKERFLNIKGKYRATIHLPEEKRYKRILLVDDILTTGATVKSCAKQLRENVSREVSILVIAKKKQ